MIFATDILIKKNTEYFMALKDKLGMNFVDSYILSGVVGFLNGASEKDSTTKDEKIVNIPRNVLTQRSSDLEFALEIVYILSQQNTKMSDKEVFYNAFATNDQTEEDWKKLTKVKEFTEFAIAGVKILGDTILATDSKGVKTNAERIVEMIDKYSIKSQKEINYNDFLVE